MTRKPSTEDRRGEVNWLLLAPRQRTVPFNGCGGQLIRKVATKLTNMCVISLGNMAPVCIVSVNDSIIVERSNNTQ